MQLIELHFYLTYHSKNINTQIVFAHIYHLQSFY